METAHWEGYFESHENKFGTEKECGAKRALLRLSDTFLGPESSRARHEVAGLSLNRGQIEVLVVKIRPGCNNW